jgi:hypothetical protein
VANKILELSVLWYAGADSVPEPPRDAQPHSIANTMQTKKVFPNYRYEGLRWRLAPLRHLVHVTATAIIPYYMLIRCHRFSKGAGVKRVMDPS